MPTVKSLRLSRQFGDSDCHGTNAGDWHGRGCHRDWQELTRKRPTVTVTEHCGRPTGSLSAGGVGRASVQVRVIGLVPAAHESKRRSAVTAVSPSCDLAALLAGSAIPALSRDRHQSAAPRTNHWPETSATRPKPRPAPVP